MHRFFVGLALCFFSSNVLQVRWRIKTYIVVASGTKQKTEDFEQAKKLGFVLWGFYPIG